MALAAHFVGFLQRTNTVLYHLKFQDHRITVLRAVSEGLYKVCAVGTGDDTADVVDLEYELAHENEGTSSAAISKMKFRRLDIMWPPIVKYYID